MAIDVSRGALTCETVANVRPLSRQRRSQFSCSNAKGPAREQHQNTSMRSEVDNRIGEIAECDLRAEHRLAHVERIRGELSSRSASERD